MPKVNLQNNLNLRNKHGYVPFPIKGTNLTLPFSQILQKYGTNYLKTFNAKILRNSRNLQKQCLNRRNINISLGAQNWGILF